MLQWEITEKKLRLTITGLIYLLFTSLTVCHVMEMKSYKTTLLLHCMLWFVFNWADFAVAKF